MASNELERVATNADSSIRQLQNALDLMERFLQYHDTHNLQTELDGLAAGEVVVGEITKERLQTLVELGDSVAYYLRSVTNGSGSTIGGNTPLGAGNLQDRIQKLGI